MWMQSKDKPAFFIKEMNGSDLCWISIRCVMSIKLFGIHQQALMFYCEFINEYCYHAISKWMGVISVYVLLCTIVCKL